MNKKILSLAIAAAVAAPMAAQADVKISGSVARDMYNETNVNLKGGDFGTSKLNIDFSEGDAFGRMAFDVRPAATKSGSSNIAMPAREQEAGIKLGGGALKIGRQANAYAGELTVDAMNATFLEARKAVGGTSKTDSFVSGLLGFSMKAGDVALNVQYGPAYKDMYTLTNPMIAGVGFKAGPVDLGIGYEKKSNDGTNTGVSAKMKFGGVKLGVSYEQADRSNTATAGAAGTAENIAFVDASMDMGGVTLGLGLGSNTTTSKTFTRVSVVKAMGKAKVYAGVANDGNSIQRAGAGLRVDM